MAAREANAHVVIVVDQLEEVLGYREDADENAFMPFIRSALDAPASPLMVIGTLRSDFLGLFQQHPSTRDFAFRDQRVGPLSTDQWVSVIEGPAMKAGIELESGLTTLMVNDTETEDALPLLAFALHELYERCHDDGVLTIAEYRETLGGLEGSVAKVAESVFNAKRR
jgi:hypothetical protein